jgi:hypothetical protein
VPCPADLVGDGMEGSAPESHRFQLLPKESHDRQRVAVEAPGFEDGRISEIR